MKWIKKGLIYNVSGRHGFDYSHCHKPTPLILDNSTIRIYFGVRSKENITRTTFIDVDSKVPTRIKYIHDRPVLDVGKIGTFDDSGANVCSVVRKNKIIYMYFIGWNPGVTVHTRNAIGLAISRDNGFTYERLYDGAIVDRNMKEPYYTGAVDVMNDNENWKMWYTSGTEWKICKNKPEIFYHIKYASSRDGIHWLREDVSSILPQNEIEVTARPCVIKEKGIYRMWYSKRDIIDFRVNKLHGYRAGYAESNDGLIWRRLDNLVGIEPSATGWDSEAIAYPYILPMDDRLLMFYNGNGFGETGFGFAEAKIPSSNQ